MYHIYMPVSVYLQIVYRTQLVLLLSASATRILQINFTKLLRPCARGLVGIFNICIFVYTV